MGLAIAALSLRLVLERQLSTVRSSADAPKVAQELQDKYQVKVQAYKCDVTNAERTVEVFAHIDRDLDPVTGLVLASRTVSCQIVS